jgi:hypothetical protein
LHLVGHFRILCYDAQKHERQVQKHVYCVGIVITKLIFDEVTRPVGYGFYKRVCEMGRDIFELLLYMSHLDTV